MDEEKSANPNAPSTCCRICVAEWQVPHSLEECCDQQHQHLSLQCMLETLFPAIFNAAQRRHDRSMNWPAKICQNCRQQVLLAYGLYEQCGASADLLERLCVEQEDATVQNDAKSPAKEEYINEEFLVENAANGSEFVIELTNMANESTVEAYTGGSIREDEDQYQLDTSGAPQELQTKRKKVPPRKTKSKRQPSTVQRDETALPRTRGKRRQGKKNEASSDVTNPIFETVENDDDETSRKAETMETKNNLYNCALCDSPTYTSPNELIEHLKKNHREQILECAHCPKVFALQSAFEHHQYCHATGRSHFCPFCDKGFQTEPLLKSHIRIHTHRADYLCSLCGKEFNHKNNLRQHMMCHSGQKPWACSLCPCRFSTKGGLTIHQNTHTKIRSFSCDTCGSQFNKHYSLIKHKLIHTGERPFGCEVCKMRFATNYMVKRHMRTHTGEKPFKCTYCERGFAQSNDLVKHMKMHVGSNPYACDRCDASFRLLTELRNHYQEHYLAGEQGAGSSAEEDKGMRFTSLDILQLRYRKEMDQQQRGKLVESCIEREIHKNEGEIQGYC